MLKVLKMDVTHDLGEAPHGDVPAVCVDAHRNRRAYERDEPLSLTRMFDAPLRAEVRSS